MSGDVPGWRPTGSAPTWAWAIGLWCSGTLSCAPPSLAPVSGLPESTPDETGTPAPMCSPSAALQSATGPEPPCGCGASGPALSFEEVGFLPFPDDVYMTTNVHWVGPVTLVADDSTPWLQAAFPSYVEGAPGLTVAWDLASGQEVLNQESLGPLQPLHYAMARTEQGVLVAEFRSGSDDRESFAAFELGESVPLWSSEHAANTGGRLDLFAWDAQSWFASERWVWDAWSGEVILEVPPCPDVLDGYGWSSTTLFDLDSDGVPELLGSQGVHDPTGLNPSVCFTTTGVTLAAQLDVDDEFEIVRLEPGPEVVRGYDSDMSLLWEAVVTEWPGYQSGLPAVGDADGDGLSDMIVQTAAELTRVRHDGTACWTESPHWRDGSAAGSSPVLHDFWGDGNPEIVTLGIHELVVLDAASGQRLGTHPITVGPESPSAIIVDQGNGAIIIVPDGERRGYSLIAATPLAARGSASAEWLSHHHNPFNRQIEPGREPWTAAVWRGTKFESNSRDGIADLSIEGAETCWDEIGESYEVVVFVKVANHGEATITTDLPIALYDPASLDLRRPDLVGLRSPPLTPSDPVAATAVVVDLAPGASTVVRWSLPIATVQEFSSNSNLGVGLSEGVHQFEECRYSNNWFPLPMYPE